MGAAPAAAALIALCLAAPPARAGECTGHTGAGRPFPTCFDPGNRLYLVAGTGGFGGGIDLRHHIDFDDEPDLVWKLEHHIARAAAGGVWRELEATLYSGRYLRHARDGHLVLPLGVPKKIFLPFDVGASAVLGRLRRARGAPLFELGVVELAGLVDLSRSADFRHRLSAGLLARWDMEIDPGGPAGPSIAGHRVVPLSAATLGAHLESRSGLSLAEVALEGGRAWHTGSGWGWWGAARADLERTLVAINDRPLSLVLEGRARAPELELRAAASLRFSLVARPARRLRLPQTIKNRSQ